MKATITFDLNDPEDRAKHKLITHVDDITHVLWQLDEYLRRIVKYDETKHEEYKTASYDIREKLHQLLNEYGLTIENIQ